MSCRPPAGQPSNWLNEITFNSSLIKELRASALLHQLIEAEGLESERYRDIYVHLIHAHEELQNLGASSKMNAEWEYLLNLEERGRSWADRFLDRHLDDLGLRSTVDLGSLFTDSFAPPRSAVPAPSSRPAEQTS
jgi:NTE family protein